MLRVQNLHKAFGRKVLFEDVNLTMTAGERLGLVGRNGSGKTTLFRLIRGELALDGGEISLPARARIGGVAQEAPGDDRTLIWTTSACGP